MQAFLTKHQLPDSYRQTAQHFFEPLVTQLLHVRQQQSTTLYIGINGSQGSGKTTLADYLVMRLRQAGQHVCALSIDDFYLTKKQRQTLAQTVHPLLATRGVPGTHDVDLAIQ
ncbi:MAG: kinase, partial [Gammaproteobacteria bacterium]